MALENATLPLERNVIEPLVDDDLDRERERVAAAGKCAVRTERRLDAATAATHVLLLLDLDQLVAHLDHVDQLRLLELVRHRPQLAAAARTRAVWIIEREHALDHRQCWLRRRSSLGPFAANPALAIFG